MGQIARQTVNATWAYPEDQPVTTLPAGGPPHAAYEAGEDILLRVRDAASAELLLVDEVVIHVVRRITRGGMSGTYEACIDAAKGEVPRELIGLRVVLKVADSDEFAANEWGHLREFRHMSVLPEPYLFGTATVLHENEPAIGEGRRAIVMEFIDGVDMAVWAQDWQREVGTPPPLESVLDVMNPVFDFIKVASTARPPLVHRDIKPENLIVQKTPAGSRCRLIDLGISGRVDASAGGFDIVGTRGFAPPEVFDPYALHPADDPRVDTFGLAATLYSVLSGSVYDYSWRGGFPIAHDDGLRARLHRRLTASLSKTYGVRVDSRTVESAIRLAFEKVDAEVIESIRLGLAPNRDDRPLPGDFVDDLPRLRMRSLLELHAASAYPALVASGSRAHASRTNQFVETGLDIQNSTLSDAVRYDGFAEDFAACMDAWNRGRYDEAVPLLRKLADAGDVTSQYNLGICIRDGLGGAQGTPAEVFWRWTKAAEEGHIVAMYNVGQCLEHGYGVPEGSGGMDVARKWYERAAAQGFPLAVERLRQIGNAQ